MTEESPEYEFYKAPSFQFYPTDFIADTSDLTAEEVGGYIRLLSRQWTHGYLPNDEASLARIAGIPIAAFKPIWGMLSRFFAPHHAVPNALGQKRLERVRATAELHWFTRTENGKRGGRPRKPGHNLDETGEQPEDNLDITGEKPDGFPVITGTEPGHKANHNQKKALRSPVSGLQENTSFAEFESDVEVYLENAAADNRTGRITAGREAGLRRELAVLRDEVGLDAFVAGLREAIGRGVAIKNYVKKCALSAQKRGAVQRVTDCGCGLGPSECARLHDDSTSTGKLPTLAELEAAELAAL